MADKRISELTGATTPLAGTEVVPVVQSSTTKKVAISDLTAGRAVSAAQLDVDNVRVDGNTISTTNTNGSLTLTPNGTGIVVSSSNMTINELNAGKGKLNEANSTVFGYLAANGIQTGAVQMTMFGAYAGYSTTTGKRQTAVGYSALFSNTTGDLNVAVGNQSLLLNTTGGANVAMGDFALQNNTTGGANTAIGYGAGSGITTNSFYNVFVGHSAGGSLTSGNNVACFGYQAQPSTATVSDEFTYGNSSVTKHRFPGGDIVIGTAGKGIDFSANTNAAGMTSELLNDYEEGTWTPVVDVNSGTATGYTIANSVYTKVGRVVTVKTNITPTGGTFGNGTGYCQISGIPFVPLGTFTGQMLNSANLTKGEFALAAVLSNSLIYIMEGITISVGNVATLQITYFV